MFLLAGVPGFQVNTRLPGGTWSWAGCKVFRTTQEAERMNGLLAAMRRSLAELDLGLKGDLTMTEPMERLMTALASDAVPPSWTLLAYPSLRPLSSWMVNLLARVAQLAEWTADLVVPKSVWLPGAPS